MDLWTILLIVLLIAIVGGGRWGGGPGVGFYPAMYGNIGGLIVLIVILFLVFGRGRL